MTDLATRVVTATELDHRVTELGHAIAADYAGDPPVLVGVLDGAVPFLADLVRTVESAIDVDFLGLTSFGDGGTVRLAADTAIPLTGRHVLVVDDLVDTGLTLASILRHLGPRECATMRVVALFDKPRRRIADVHLDYRGFEVEDEFLIGYGLDYHGWFRNLPAVWAVLDLPAMTANPAAFAADVFGWSSDRLEP